ncbi:MAG: cache domain-containing protein, partial [Pseudomonadota bacterium]
MPKQLAVSKGLGPARDLAYDKPMRETALLPVTPSAPQGTRRRGVALVMITIAVIVLALSSYVALSSQFLRAASLDTPQRATFYADAIDAALTRLEHLPYVLSVDPNLQTALETGDADALNPLLAQVAQKAGAEFVYVLDQNGRTLASSNYREDTSLVGRHYTFR